ncbi:MAG TPA: hypothetical protein VLC55_01900 [Burkholderiales bacterium]|nr:hypothetical protein [Burkholderiales bacterium]
MAMIRSFGVAAALLALSSAAPAAEPAQVWRGMMVDRLGKIEFYACGERTPLRPVDATPEKDLKPVFRRLSGPYEQAVFMMVEGTRKDATLRVTQLLRAYREGIGCREDLVGIEFKAFGNEPDWRMAMDGNALRFQRLEDQAPASFPYQPLRREGGNLEVRAQAESADIKVVLKRERCTDTMADAIYPYRAEVVSGGETYRGCAYLGDGAKPGN